MYHLHLELKDPETDIETVVRQLNFELAAMSVQIIRHYSGPRLGSRRWNLIFRDVTEGNWERMRAIVARVLRGYDCRYVLKRPTQRAPTAAG